MVDPSHYDNTSPTVISKSGVSYASLTTFTQTLGTACAGTVTYNLGVGNSYGAATWYWWDATAFTGIGGWVAANGTQAKSNTSAQVQSHVATFKTDVGTGTVYFKAFLNSDGSTACELDQLELNGQQ